QHPSVSRELDARALDSYCTFRYVPGPGTVFADVVQLLPGHLLAVTERCCETRPYWTLPDDELEGAEMARAAADVGAALRESVSRQLAADVPLAVYLSGGLDSSLICAYAAQARAGQVGSFTVQFAEPGFDESMVAESVAAHCGSRHHLVPAKQPRADEATWAAWLLDQPMADAAVLPVLQMAAVTKPVATVVLTGEGADECYGGYSQLRLAWHLTRSPYRHIAPLVGSLAHAAAAWHRRLHRLVHFAKASGDTVELAYRMMAQTTLEDKLGLYGERMRGTLSDSEEAHLALMEARLGPTGSPYQRFTRLYLTTFLPDELLVKTDRMTMAYGVEARVPYLSPRLTELAVRLPAQCKIRGWTGKLVLRVLAAQVLPAQVAWRRKHSFDVPIAGLIAATQDSSAHREARRLLVDAGILHERLAALARPYERMPVQQQRILWFLECWARAYRDTVCW
ncbi:MAG: asparagine synthetase B family protein, partial [Armatimonadota bacterium]